METYFLHILFLLPNSRIRRPQPKCTTSNLVSTLLNTHFSFWPLGGNKQKLNRIVFRSLLQVETFIWKYYTKVSISCEPLVEKDPMNRIFFPDIIDLQFLPSIFFSHMREKKSQIPDSAGDISAGLAGLRCYRKACIG